jgi:sulfur carrier protein
MSDTIIINGQRRPLAAASVAALLQQQEIGADARGVAVAINGAVVPRAEWHRTPLNAGDAVEIVRARQGG